ncbi:MAG: permease prefix domain 1-containing protein [Verrucomicrobiaceae bacterium]
MNAPHTHRIEEFLRSFAQALRHPGGSRDEIIAEIRADLAAHINRHQSAGKSPAEAVDLALAELGDSQELARTHGPAATPMQSSVINTIRYIAAGGMMLWVMAMILFLRGGSYGWAGLEAVVFIALLHMPLILLVWPGIIWRKNWLFGLIPAGIAVLICLSLQFGGVETEGRIDLSSALNTEGTGEEVALPPQRIGLIAALVGTNLFLILAMQRRNQQRIILLAVLVGVSVVEIPFQIEELVFRRRIQEARERYEEQARNAPDNTAAPSTVLGQPRSSSNSRDGFVVELNRAFPLSGGSGFTLVYHSTGNRVEVRD